MHPRSQLYPSLVDRPADIEEARGVSETQAPPPPNNKRRLLIIFLVCLVLGALAVMTIKSTRAPLRRFNLTKRFGTFIGKFKKAYKSKQAEDAALENFRMNLAELAAERAHQRGLELRLHEWMDLTPEEIAEKYHLMLASLITIHPDDDDDDYDSADKKPRADDNQTFEPDFEDEDEEDPDQSFNPYEKNVEFSLVPNASRVKNQGGCGSCWAFAVVAAVETAATVAGWPPVDLSEQQLVDCEPRSDGCDGGYIGDAMEFVRVKGLVAERDYPYRAVNAEYCRPLWYAPRTHVKAVRRFEHGEEAAMAEWLRTKGPLAIAMRITPAIFAYESGVYSPSERDCEERAVGSHAMVIMGYGTTRDGQDYWIVKNSWGEKWGDAGYIKIARGRNSCGLAERVVAPVF